MHSIHRSRGRILFEVFCALAISASCLGTWMQTGAWALLPAALVAALYALVRASDLARRSPAIEQEVAVPEAAADEQPTSEIGIEEAQSVEPSAPPKRERRTKVRRKGGDRRAKRAKVSEPAPPEESNVTEFVLGEEAEVAAPAPAEKAEDAATVPAEEVPHVPPARLFEPEPYVRQQRATFGRKAG